LPDIILPNLIAGSWWCSGDAYFQPQRKEAEKINADWS